MFLTKTVPKSQCFFFTFEIRYEKKAPKNFRRFAAKKDPQIFFAASRRFEPKKLKKTHFNTKILN